MPFERNHSDRRVGDAALWAAAIILAGIGVYMYTRPKVTAASVTAPAVANPPSSAATAAGSPPATVNR